MNKVEPLDQSIGTNSTDLPQDESEVHSNDGDDTIERGKRKPSSAETLKMEEKINEDANHSNDHDTISDSRNEETPSSLPSTDNLQEKLVELDEKPESKIIEDHHQTDETEISDHELDPEKWFVILHFRTQTFN